MISHYSLPGLTKRDKNDSILSALCRFYNVSITDLMKKTRRREICEKRQMAFYMLYEYGTMGLKEIGKVFNLDHTTVLHGKNHIKALMFSDRSVSSDVQRIVEGIREMVISI